MGTAEMIQMFASLIGSLGFPIVMVFLLWQYIRDEQGKTREVLSELRDTITALQNIIGGRRSDDDKGRF